VRRYERDGAVLIGKIAFFAGLAGRYGERFEDGD
jgi:hypothetical protein